MEDVFTEADEFIMVHFMVAKIKKKSYQMCGVKYGQRKLAKLKQHQKLNQSHESHHRFMKMLKEHIVIHASIWKNEQD